jgi:hypothetical protein
MATDTTKQILDAGQPEMLVNSSREAEVTELPMEFGETRNPEVIRNRPNPDPHFGNPGPNPIAPLTKAQQQSVASAAERSPDVITGRTEEELEAEEKQAQAALKSAGVESKGPLGNSSSRQQKSEHDR